MFKAITQSPFLNLFSGLILLISSGYETWLTLEESSLGSHHGILVFALVQIIKAIPEIFHGVKELEAAHSLSQ